MGSMKNARRYAVVVIGLISLMFYVASNELKQLPDYGAVPKWTFVNQDGESFGTMDLYGRPWVANFIFTSCPRACPLLAQSTKQLQDVVPLRRESVCIVVQVNKPIVLQVLFGEGRNVQSLLQSLCWS